VDYTGLQSVLVRRSFSEAGTDSGTGAAAVSPIPSPIGELRKADRVFGGDSGSPGMYNREGG
jgi:hypothetical protein